MKFSGLILSLLVTANIFAASVNEAATLYTNRVLDVNNSLKSADMYGELAAAETDSLKKVQLLNKQSEAIYFYGQNASIDNDLKISMHDKGAAVAQGGIDLLAAGPGVSKNPAFDEALAESYYFWGANKGKWAEARGIASSLSQWPNLKEAMENIIKLKKVQVQDFGAFRILGRAYYKLPWPLGDKELSLKYLKTANTKTAVAEGDISINSTNVVYYADILIAKGLIAEAKQVLSGLIAKNDNYNPRRVPETIKDKKEAQNILSKL
ncbi:MAG: hypothetical protein U0T83_03710 [Bacteriovoracaceae bacterium]